MTVSVRQIEPVGLSELTKKRIPDYFIISLLWYISNPVSPPVRDRDQHGRGGGKYYRTPVLAAARDLGL